MRVMTPPETPTPEIPKERIEEAHRAFYGFAKGGLLDMALRDFNPDSIAGRQILNIARHLHSLHQQIAEAENETEQLRNALTEALMWMNMYSVDPDMTVREFPIEQHLDRINEALRPSHDH